MKGDLGNRRPRLKSLAAASAQDKRRQDFITRQKRARRDLSAHARFLATAPPLDDQDEVEQEGVGSVRSSLANAGSGSPELGSQEEDLDMLVDEAEINHEADGSSRNGGAEAAGTRAAGAKGRRRSRGSQRGDSALTPRMMMQRDHWANQICLPEWMLTVPSDLNGAGSSSGSGWYVMPRPEGKRVLLISANGQTIARQMSGAVMHRFSSHLPGGSAANRRGASKGGGYCILDCVFHELDETFFVLDMMAWKGYPLYDCTTDFRLYWVRTKLLEAEGPLDIVSQENAYRIKATPYLECDRQGLAHAYASPVPYIRDGLLFYLKAGHYQLGPTPLVLIWKDARVARYLGMEGPQAVVLRVGEHDSGSTVTSERESFASGETRPEGGASGAAEGFPRTMDLASASAEETSRSAKERGALRLMTCDGLQLGEIGAEGSDTYVPRAKPGELLRFTLAGVEEGEGEDDEEGITPSDEHGSTGAGEAETIPAAAGIVGLKFDKRCSRLRPIADTWSKVLFQARLRRSQTITIEEIAAQASIPHAEDARAGHAVTSVHGSHGGAPAAGGVCDGDGDDDDDDHDML